MNKNLTSVEDAISIILKRINLLPSNEIPLINGIGRTLSEPIISKLNNPPANVSSMDGYAVKNSDLEKGIYKFYCIDESIAGKKSIKTIKSGETVRIYTGAIIPVGADRVILQENTLVKSNNLIEIKNNKIDLNNFFIRKKGMDFKIGETLIDKGVVVNSRLIALAVASGNSWAMVRRKPRIAILSTGDELSKFGDLIDTCNNEKIISSNGIFLYNFIKQLGGDPFFLPTAQDNLKSLELILHQSQGYDLVVSTGGASVGDYDLVQTALKNQSFKLLFWKIAMRPGKPVFFGALKNIPFLGLPGNPVSTGVCSIVFLKKIIQSFLGQKIIDDISYIRLKSDLEKNDHRQDYVRSKITSNVKGDQFVSPFLKQDSSQLSIFSKADSFIIRRPNQGKIKKGTKVPVITMPNLI